MFECLEIALQHSPKRFRESSLKVYRSIWKRLALTLDPTGQGPRPFSSVELERAISSTGAYATAKKALGLFRWVSETVRVCGLHLGTAYLELEHQYKEDDRPEHSVRNFEQNVVKLAAQADHHNQSWKGARLAALVRLLGETGIRREELLALELSDARPDALMPNICAGKGNRRRVLPLSPDAVNALNAWLKVRPACDSNFLFISGKTGAPMDASTVWRQLRRLEAVVGPADKALSGPGAFRAGVAHKLKKSGVPATEIQRILGHRLATSTEELLNRV